MKRYRKIWCVTATIIVIVLLTFLLIQRNTFKNWYKFNNFKGDDIPVRTTVVLDKQQSVMLKFIYPRGTSGTYISCTSPCMSVSVSGVDGIYSNSYVLIGVSGVFQGKGYIIVQDSNENVIGKLPVRVTNKMVEK